MPDSDDDSAASSVSGGSCDYESDLEDTFDDLCRQDDADASAAYDAGPDEQWTHITHSDRSAKMFDGLNKRVLPSRTNYNYADSILLARTKAEVKHSLKSLRQKLKLPSDHKFDAVEAFAGAMPAEFVSVLFEWLKAGQSNKGDELVSFVDIIAFIRCDVILRVFHVPSSKLRSFGVTEEQFKRYKRVHAAMTEADMPAAKRDAMAVANTNDNDLVNAGAAAESFDRIMEEVIDAINKEWAKNFFVPGVSWIDVDDDKLNNCSPKFQAYGFKRTPTKAQSAGKNKGKRTRRGCCVLCCNLCDEWVKEPKTYSHSRQGRKTVDYCTACKVYLCKHYFDIFHNEADVTPPPCCPGFGMQTRPKRKRMRRSQESPSTISSPVHSSPKTSSRKKRSRASLSPQGRTSITSTSARSSPKTSSRKRRSHTSSSPQGSTSITSSPARSSPKTSSRKRHVFVQKYLLQYGVGKERFRRRLLNPLHHPKDGQSNPNQEFVIPPKETVTFLHHQKSREEIT